jgi:hypothetical protein
MTIDERLEALAQHVEVMATMQLESEKRQQEIQQQLKRLTREVRLFRHFVLSMGANLESRVLNLEGRLNEGDEQV